MKYLLRIAGKHLNSEQTWTKVGQDKAGNTVIANFTNYAKDTTLTIDQNLNIIDGYEFIFNPGNVITVSEIE